MAKMLFPPFLQQGSKGAAVDVLHIILCALGFGVDIQRDGDYGELTMRAVRGLQIHLGFRGDDVDGNFGPETRAKLKEKMGIDVDVSPSRPAYSNITEWFGPDGGPYDWDPDEDDQPEGA